MILTLISGVVIWLGNSVVGLFKAKQAEVVQTTTDLKYTCPPAYTLPNDLPQWKIDLYREQCPGKLDYHPKTITVKVEKAK